MINEIIAQLIDEYEVELGQESRPQRKPLH